MDLTYTAATMNVFFAFLALFAAAASVQQRAPISADEVTLRHTVYGNELRKIACSSRSPTTRSGKRGRAP